MRRTLALLATATMTVVAGCSGGASPRSTTAEAPEPAATAPRVLAVELGEAGADAPATQIVRVTFDRPMRPDRVTVGSYRANVSCASYDALDTIVVEIDGVREDRQLERRCLGGSIYTEDWTTYRVTLHRPIEHGDTVRVWVRTRTRVEEGINRIPTIRPVVDRDGTALAEGVHAVFHLDEPRFGSVAPTTMTTIDPWSTWAAFHAPSQPDRG